MLRDIPFETTIEHTVDFIQLIGCPALYNEKTAIIQIEDWKGALPCDFYKMIQVRVAPTQHNPRWDGNCGVIAPLVYRASGHSFHMSDFKPDTAMTGELTYKLQNSVIFTSTKNVDVEIAYTAFAVDDEGFPLLPDNASFLRSLEAYIKMKWFEAKFDEGEIPQAVMDRADQQYCWAVGDAQSEFARLSLDEAETLFNSFKSMLPRNNEHWKAFFTAGAKEIMR